MFSGLNLTTTEIVRSEYRAGSLFLILKMPKDWTVQKGDSVSVDGIYLPVREILDGQIITEAIKTVVTKTSLDLAIPKEVTIEKALNPNDGISGHLMYGTIDTVGILEDIEKEASSSLYVFSCSDEYKRFMVKSGFVAVNGISTQITDVEEESFEVRFANFILQQSAMGKKKIGEYVNIEFDMMIRYIDKILKYKS